MTHLRTRLLSFAAAITAALLAASVASAQVSLDDRRCIEEINNGSRKVLLVENQALLKCVRAQAKGTLGIPIVDCASPTFSTRVVKTMSKAVADANKRCPAGPPSFGPPSLTQPPILAVQTGVDLLGDLFGPNPESSIFSETAVKRCQENVLKAVHRCEDTRLKEFLRCKKAAMKSGTVTDEATLRDVCLGTSGEQPDPKARIARSCDAAIVNAVNACTDDGVSLTQAFPACNDGSASGLASCLGERMRCRTCNLLNDVDGITKDCDVFDDGDDGNQSCDEPTTCGDMLVDGQENCEDGNAVGGDGCSAACQIEGGWSCAGAPSVCTEICGDGLVVGSEACDDDNNTSGDGCDAACNVEPGYSCTGAPSACNEICGDGMIVGAEQCDDGNAMSSDGCSSQCAIEPGYACNGVPSTCAPFDVVITSPVHGTFTTASSVNVTGFIDELAPALASLTINGAPVPVNGDGTFSTTLPLDAAAIFNPIRATVTDPVHGGTAHDRVVVHRGLSIADGAFSPQSIALRLNDTGLDEVEPLVADLAGSGLDLAALLPVGTVLVNNECFIDSIFGCLGRATVRIANPPPSFQSFELEADSMTNFVAGDITVNGISVDVFLDGSGLVPDCPIGLDANQAFFFGDYTLSPDAVTPDNIDVNQTGPLDIAFAGFNVSFGGICDAPIIGDIIQAFMPDVEDLTIDAMRNFLNDPDGAGPQDGPIGNAIEEALAGISISGPIGAGLGVMLETPLFAVNEDNVGITLGSNGRITSQFGGGPGQCIPPAGAPNLTASLAFNEVFPSFGQNAPVSGQPYDVSIAISAEGFNQLLKAQTECGLLVTSITELDLGTGPIPLTAGILSFFMPQFAVFPPATPFRLDIRPTLAPIVTGAAGPGGELTELRVANVLASLVRDDGSEQITLTAAFDAKLGMDLDFIPGALGVVLSPPAPGDLTIAIIENPLGVNESALENDVLPPLVGTLLPDLASSLSSFPLPTFFGLQLDGVEVSRTGLFLSLYATLEPAP
jgi:cysteine-rich repeat protein